MFYIIFHLFLRPLNILSTSFRAKTETLHSGRNSWPVRTRSIFVQNLPQLFFLSKGFSFFSLTTKYAICMFSCKNAEIVFRSKFLTSWIKGHFHRNFTLFIVVFFLIFVLYNFPLVSETSEYTISEFSCKNGDIPLWSKFLTCRNLGYFGTNFSRFFFSFERIFHFFLGPLNMLFAS